MIPSPRKALTGHVDALRREACGHDRDGMPTLCPRGVAEELHAAAKRWESVCRRAAELLAQHGALVEGEEPQEAITEAEEQCEEIERWFNESA